MGTDLSQARSGCRTYLAAIEHSGNYDVDRLLGDVARHLKQQGFRVGGAIRSEGRRAGAHRCDMSLEELTTGKSADISQQLGPGSQGCRLDAAGLEQVVGMVDASIESGGLDILIVNKFGKQEADGGGFTATIARAVMAEIPVLVTLNQDYRATWLKFCGDEGQLLPADRSCVLKWLAEALPDGGEGCGILPKACP